MTSKKTGKAKKTPPPPPGRLRPGNVWRLCVGCDRQIQKGEKEAGPFLCYRCRYRLSFAPLVAGTPERQDLSPARLARVKQLAKMYQAVLKKPSESVAKAAGLVTSVSDLPHTQPNDTNANPATAKDGCNRHDAA